MTIEKPHFQLEVEALRGFCAMGVLYCHMIMYSEKLIPGFHLYGYIPSGLLLVLVFFSLSGFVIGLSNNESLSVRSYLTKRIVRLYPIYFIVLTFSLTMEDPLRFKVLGNYLFLQNAFCDVPLSNDPLWSLNYEVIYYLLFLGVFFVKKYAGIIAIFCFTVCVLFSTVLPALFLAYLVGFVFWMTGFWVSTLKFQSVEDKKCLAVMALLLAAGHLNILQVGFKQINIVDVLPKDQAVGVLNLPLLFYCFIALVICTGRLSKYHKLFLIMGYIFVISDFIYCLIYNLPYSSFAFLFCLVSIIMLFFPLIPFAINILSEIGSISYAVYIIHMPVMIILAKVPFGLGEGLLEFFIKSIIFLIIVFVLSYFLERKWHPWAKKYFLPKKRIAPSL